MRFFLIQILLLVNLTACGFMFEMPNQHMNSEALKILLDKDCFKNDSEVMLNLTITNRTSTYSIADKDQFIDQVKP